MDFEQAIVGVPLVIANAVVGEIPVGVADVSLPVGGRDLIDAVDREVGACRRRRERGEVVSGIVLVAMLRAVGRLRILKTVDRIVAVVPSPGRPGTDRRRGFMDLTDEVFRRRDVFVTAGRAAVEDPLQTTVLVVVLPLSGGSRRGDLSRPK